MSAKTKYYNTGGGELFFTPIENGVLGVEAPFGQTENVSFSSSVETITHDNTEGAVTFEDMNLLSKITGKITIDSIEISPDMLTKAFLGTRFTTAVTSGVGTVASVSITNLDVNTYIGAKQLSNVSVTDDGDITTYTEGVDYTLDLVNGGITALSTGSILAGDVLHVTYDNAAYNDIRIEAFTESKLEGVLRFSGKSASGLNYTYTFHKVSLLASGDFALKSATEFAKISFEGSMLVSDLISASGVSKLFKIEASELS